jgi:hypothetical protein
MLQRRARLRDDTLPSDTEARWVWRCGKVRKLDALPTFSGPSHISTPRLLYSIRKEEAAQPSVTFPFE